MHQFWKTTQQPNNVTRLLIALAEWALVALVALTSLFQHANADPQETNSVENVENYSRAPLRLRVESVEGHVSEQLHWNQSAIDAIERLNSKIQSMQVQIERQSQNPSSSDSVVRSEIESLRLELKRVKRLAAESNLRLEESLFATRREHPIAQQKSTTSESTTPKTIPTVTTGILASFRRQKSAAALNPSATSWMSSDAHEFLWRERDGRLLLSAVSDLDGRSSQYVCTLDTKDNKTWSGYTYQFPIDGLSKEKVAADLVLERQSESQAKLTIHFMETRLFKASGPCQREMVLHRE